MSLIAKAHGDGVDQEKVDLALAWLEGRVTNAQAAHALDRSTSNQSSAIYHLANVLRAAVRQGAIAVAKVQESKP